MTVLDPALTDSLRTLKLSGMLETLDARLTQAQAGQLGHLDFLQVLCQDEIARREAMSMTRRLRRAHFDQQATLEGFDFAASPKLPTAQIRDLAALRWLHSGESILLHGTVGVGKTHGRPGPGPFGGRGHRHPWLSNLSTGALRAPTVVDSIASVRDPRDTCTSNPQGAVPTGRRLSYG